MLVEISLGHLSGDVIGQLVVQKQPVSVQKGGSVIIGRSHLDNSPLERAISDLVPPSTHNELQVFYVVRETPVNGVLQVTLVASCSYACT